MSKILSLLILLVLVLSVVVIFRGAKDTYQILPANLNAPVVSTPFENWREFKTAQGHFKVLLPLLPQHAAESVTDPQSNETRKYDMYVSETNNGSIFMISLITYPKGDDDVLSDVIQKKVIQEMMGSNPKNVLLFDHSAVIEGKKGRDFAIENPEVRISGREFMVGKTLYLVTYVAKGTDFNQAEYDHFVNSFQLTQ